MAKYKIITGWLEAAGALADEGRIRIFMALSRCDLCVCQITELLKLAPSTVSKHLTVLRHAGIIEFRKTGRWIHYRRRTPRGVISQALKTIEKNLRRDETIRKDLRMLAAILKMDPEVLCRRQLKKGGSLRRGNRR